MTVRNWFIFFAATQALTVGAAPETNLMVEDAYEAEVGQLFYEEDYMSGRSPLSQFENVIVVNKAERTSTNPDGQKLRLYSKGVRQFISDISSGKEDVEKVKGLKKFGRKLFGGKGTLKSHWRHTTRGHFVIDRVEKRDYQSGESKFHMPYAMFFDTTHGLALHEVPWEFSADGHAQLGSRASSGCVRVDKDRIVLIHDAVSASGRGMIPVIDIKTGHVALNPDGSMKMQNGFKSIVVVEEVNDPATLKPSAFPPAADVVSEPADEPEDSFYYP